jgi:CrcB protein
MNKISSKELVLVFVGGALGALLRYLIGVALEQFIGPTNANSLSLYIVNIVGATFLGFINSNPNQNGQLFWGAGFSGGFTTMSGVAVFTYTQVPVLVLPSLAVMFGLGFIGYAAGNNLGRVLGNKK